jgi:hypothetical protein
VAGLRLQLDASALSKLLTDISPEVTVELRQSVIEEFTRRHLKGLLNEELLRKFHSRMQQLFDDEAERIIGKINKDYWGSSETTLHNSLVDRITKKVNETIDIVLDARIKNDRDKFLTDLEAKINRAIEASVSFNIKDKVKKEVDAKLEEIDRATRKILNKE